MKSPLWFFHLEKESNNATDKVACYYKSSLMTATDFLIAHCSCVVVFQLVCQTWEALNTWFSTNGRRVQESSFLFCFFHFFLFTSLSKQERKLDRNLLDLLVRILLKYYRRKYYFPFLDPTCLFLSMSSFQFHVVIT